MLNFFDSAKLSNLYKKTIYKKMASIVNLISKIGSYIKNSCQII